jgi:hypothetical protein
MAAMEKNPERQVMAGSRGTRMTGLEERKSKPALKLQFRCHLHKAIVKGRRRAKIGQSLAGQFVGILAVRRALAPPQWRHDYQAVPDPVGDYGQVQGTAFVEGSHPLTFGNANGRFVACRREICDAEPPRYGGRPARDAGNTKVNTPIRCDHSRQMSHRPLCSSFILLLPDDIGKSTVSSWMLYSGIY